MLQSRVFLAFKNAESPDRYFKARLVVLGHVDPDKPRVVNEASTGMKSSISLIASYGYKYGVQTYQKNFWKAKIHCLGRFLFDHGKYASELGHLQDHCCMR